MDTKDTNLKTTASTPIDRESIRQLLEPYVQLPLECDGMTRVITYLLQTAKIPHRVYVGTIHFNVKGKGEFSPHFWIRLGTETGEIIDYRSRMWFGGDMDIPQGIFKEDPKVISYDGREIALPVSKTVFSILTG